MGDFTPQRRRRMARRMAASTAAGLATALVLTMSPGLRSEDAQTNAPSVSKAVAQSGAKNPSSAAPKARRSPHKLTGAELYSIHCNRCHPERYPTERTGAQWKTIMLHMRVRANLPAEHARRLLQYLQENSGR